ncbi:hypothetical protein AA18890_2548 [Komagataeibacter europaeus LMG 18890]|nr:hypothetical protein AA18890_2548 [Komagataeibacter europaeus LMG 18890]
MEKRDIAQGIEKGSAILAQQDQRTIKQPPVHISRNTTGPVIGHAPRPAGTLRAVKRHAPGIKAVHQRPKRDHGPAWRCHDHSPLKSAIPCHRPHPMRYGWREKHDVSIMADICWRPVAE